MFPFVVDHRHTLESSLQIYRASRSVFKANTRGQRNPQSSYSATEAPPPPAYTPTAEPIKPHGPTRKATSGSTATMSSTISSSSSTSSTSSTRSRLARLNPFRRRHNHSSSHPNRTLSPSTADSSPNPSTSSTSSSCTASTTRGQHRSRTVHFADPYDSDAPSVHSTDFAPTERRQHSSSKHSSSNDASSPNFTSGATRMGYPRDVEESSMYPAFLFLF